MVAMRSGSVGGVIRREPCKKCSLPVFLAERLNVNNYLYHRTCFRCARCSHQLSLANYYETEQGEYCCEACPDEVTVQEIETVVTKALSDDEKVTKLSDEEFDNLYALEEAKLVTKARSYFMESQFGKDMVDGEEETEVKEDEPELEGEEPPPELPLTKPPEITIETFPNLDILLEKPLEETSLETLVTDEKLVTDEIEDTSIKIEDIITSIEGTSNEVVAAVETETDNVNKPSLKDLVDKQPLANLESNIVTKDKDEVNSDKVTHEGTNKDYPEDLNPFGNDDEVPSTNPFGSDDEEETQAAKESLNPFGSDDEDELINEAVNAIITKRPIPKPRNLNPETLKTPEPSPRKQFGSTTSLESSISGKSAQTPTGTYRKKKPAPPPPTTKDIFGEVSPTKLSTTPGGTVRLRKSRPAPAPPTAKSPILVEESVEAQNQVLIAQVNELEYEKISKDEKNRNRQSLSSFKTSASSSDGISDLITPLSPDKSTYGKWKRKKGPAPPRPLPQRRQINILSPDELRQQLDVIEIQQQGLEKQGVKLEQIIREKCEIPGVEEESSISIEVEDLVLQLFELVNEKNELFRKQAELMYLRRQQRLEEEHADLEYQIRCLMDRPERNKTDYDKAREEELINRLIEVVERRNEIVECLEMDRLREKEEDKSISTHLTLLAAKRDELSPESGKLSKKEKKKQKKIKKNKDVDKDVDETEPGVKKEKKKKWLFKIPG